MTMEHEHYMRAAIEMGKQSGLNPFGAVIVDRRSGDIIARGVNGWDDNPILHGEIAAINRCAETHRNEDWGQFSLYTTAEPCPMCQSAVAWAGISKVYYGTSVPMLTELGWDQIQIRAEEVADRSFFRSKIVGGVLETECDALFRTAMDEQKRRVGEAD